ncbi:MAG TPA: patatin-like phospholipase family protein [Thermoanaerobaculia bacterium]|nr:patatin-like phospholipase family protein [Thermoanaerobaculia bacterium]
MNGLRTGIVLSGGGATGAYEVGVVKALLNGKVPVAAERPFVPDICAGTSIGSFNAAFLVSHLAEFGPGAAGNLDEVWRYRLAEGPFRSYDNGVFRLRGNPFTYFNPLSFVPDPFTSVAEFFRDSTSLAWDGLNQIVGAARVEGSWLQRLAMLVDLSAFIDLDPFHRTMQETLSFPNIRATAVKLRVAATNWTTGALTVFKNVEMSDHTGPLAILASSAVPGIFPPAFIGAESYVDGGVVMNTPLRLVTRHADVIYVTYLDPDIRAIPLSDLQSTISAAVRQQSIAWAHAVNNDIEQVRAINGVLEIFGRLGQGEPIPEDRLSALPQGLFQLWQRQMEIRQEAGKPPYHLLTVHRFHPRDDLSGGPLGILNLERNHVDELIDRGYTDAMAHDCKASGCLLPARD